MTFHVDFTSPGFTLPAVLVTREDFDLFDKYADMPTAMGIEAEELDMADEREAWEHEQGMSVFWEGDAVSQGFYDDDPNPYHGDYAEDDGY